MIKTDNLTLCTWKVLDADKNPQGTAFFVTENLLLTSLHVVEDFADQEFSIMSIEETIISVKLKDRCKINDLAILITEEYTSDHHTVLCSEEPHIGTEWCSFGFPATAEGLKVGSKINGTIHDIIRVPHEHDIVLASPGITITSVYKGFSGSAVLNASEEVTSVLRYKDTNNLCSVSIKKVEFFLADSGIPVKDDTLGDFNPYMADAFQHTADPFQAYGIALSKTVVKKTSPQNIASGLLGKLMVPEQTGSLKEVIGYLKSQTAMNKELWVTWLEFLTYVEFLKGEYADINTISVILPQAEVSKLIPGVETKITQDINLKLQFYFTEEKAYISIAKQYLLEKAVGGELQHNQCHIFHSHNPRFGLQSFTQEEKKKIIFNIAGAPDAGPSIAGAFDCGVLSFAELTTKAAVSSSLPEITNNLIQIFTDAIS